MLHRYNIKTSFISHFVSIYFELWVHMFDHYLRKYSWHIFLVTYMYILTLARAMQEHLLSGYVTLSHKIMRPFHKQQFIRIGSVFSLLFLGGWGVGGALGPMGSLNWVPLALLAKNSIFYFLDKSNHKELNFWQLEKCISKGKRVQTYLIIWYLKNHKEPSVYYSVACTIL